MGLDTTHDCWHGAYSAFMRFRQAIAKCIGIDDLMKMQGYGPNTVGIPWASLPYDPLHKLLYHSDCSGHLEVEDLIPIAERLEAIIHSLTTYDTLNEPVGHLAAVDPSRHAYGTAGAAKRFAAGCRLAASLGERVEFH